MIMTEFRIPAANWSDELASALRRAVPGDTVSVRTEPMLRLAEVAAERMGKTGLRLALAETGMRGDSRPAAGEPGPEYRVIYRFGRTEVAGIGTYETREEAEAETREADDEGLDETWVEEVPPS